MGYARKFHKRLANETCNMLTFVLGAAFAIVHGSAGVLRAHKAHQMVERIFVWQPTRAAKQRTASTADGKKRPTPKSK